MTGCGRLLDYDTPRLDGSAEADHILEARHGTDDSVENLRVICRKCNRDRTWNKPHPHMPGIDAFPLSHEW